jgi:hypothetical protein
LPSVKSSPAPRPAAAGLPKGRKRRPDAWEIRAGLTEAQLAQVFAWARNLGYARALELVATELKVKPPNVGNFGAWYSMYARAESESRVHKAIVDAAVIRQLAKNCGDVSEAMTAALESEASAAILSNDPERIKLLVGLALKARHGKREESELSLDREKFAEQVRKNAEARATLQGLAADGKAAGLDRETIAKIEEAAKLL